MTSAEAVDKVRKLLALANDSASTEEEAATAMAMAHKLMQKHRIAEIELDQESKDEGFEVDPTPFAYMGKKHTSWKTSLANAMAHHNGCYIWLNGSNICIAGRPQDTEVARTMYKFVARQVMTMATGYKGKGAKWLRAWRVGVIVTIDERLRTITEELKRETTSTALVVVENRAVEVANYVHSKMRFGKSRGGSRTGYDTDGWLQGRADGHKVRIHDELE